MPDATTVSADPVELTVRLMSIDSTSGHESDVIHWLDQHLAGRGWRTQRIPVSPGRDDLYATNSDARADTSRRYSANPPPSIPACPWCSLSS